jgi:hypothetical protein
MKIKSKVAATDLRCLFYTCVKTWTKVGTNFAGRLRSLGRSV